ncbi:hypothetical protein [Methylobacterium sp. 77]|uniref:hypothetical protein n=1 Tax=Methylobacterium sp. 77 TaxID=1101192 RepID=UPI00037FE781|nr:hypothetical protein [Methylobacterium sp. 77]
MSGTVIRGSGRPVTATSTAQAKSPMGRAKRLTLLGGVSLVGLYLVIPAAGQAENPDETARAPAIIAAPGSSAAAGMVDESALRYYASQKQTVRMKAEAARLKHLYPGWTEPTDLDTLQPSPPEEAPLWDLFTAGRFDDLDAAIAARRAADPNWRPSDELARKLLRASFRSRLKTFASARKNTEVVALYRADPTALDPSDVESYWTTAEALAGEGGAAEAFGLYKSVLDTSNDAGARLATIQKAMANLPMTLAEKLIAMGRTDPEGASEFRGIANDITRARIVADLHGEPAQEPSPAEMAAFQAYARSSGEPSQTGLLGWYSYNHRQFRAALDWFKLAISRGGDAMIAHGLAHTLRELGMLREAEEVAYAWRDKYVGNSILFIDLMGRKLTQANPSFIDLDRISRYAKVTLATASGEGAEALGWYAYNSCQFDAALEWFQHAAAWLPGESALTGYALSLQRLKRTRDYLTIVNRYDGLFPKVVDLLFREGPAGPPLACAASADAAPPQAARPAPGAPANPAPSALARNAAAYGRVPKPDPSGDAQVKPLPIQRNEFPLAVPSENALRYAPPSLARIASDRQDGAFLAEPSASKPVPLVARRVPGAGPMPYERYGYNLLPGYDGSERPTVQSEPGEGTLWRTQQAARSRGVQERGPSETDRFTLPGSQAVNRGYDGPDAATSPMQRP